MFFTYHKIFWISDPHDSIYCLSMLLNLNRVDIRLSIVRYTIFEVNFQDLL